jgi:hypothetical protein
MSDNTTPEPQPSEQEKLRRERLLLLADMSPSAADVTINQLFTEPGGDFSVRDELKPYTGPVRPDEEPTP